jgi:hypothetical protein
MTLQDVFAHPPILAQNAPAAELRGNLFEYTANEEVKTIRALSRDPLPRSSQTGS